MFFSPLQSRKINRTARALFAFGVLFAAVDRRTLASPQTSDPPAANIPVFITDFELLSATPNPVSAKPPATPQDKQKPQEQKSLEPLVYQDAEAPTLQARRLIDFFTATLLQTLQKSGYHATQSSSRNPSSGALLRGVFAEPDAHNRIRRALLGGTSINPRFLLYVGIFNLARTDQPLYRLAEEQSPSSKYGPVITLNNYIPLAKYELDKNPTDEEVRKICVQIAASLTGLLTANPAAFSH